MEKNLQSDHKQIKGFTIEHLAENSFSKTTYSDTEAYCVIIWKYNGTHEQSFRLGLPNLSLTMYPFSIPTD